MDLCLWILNRKKTAIEIWILHVVRDSVWKHGADTRFHKVWGLQCFQSIQWIEKNYSHIIYT